MDIGQTLKEAREAKSLTLEEIQEMTKIQKRYLAAIEENNFSSLPGQFYARAFIKEYAAVLELDAEEILEHFNAEAEPVELDQEKVTYSRLERNKVPKEAGGTSIFSVVPTIIVVVLIIAIIVVAWMFLQKSSSNSDDNAVQNDNEIIRNVKDDSNNDENENNNNNANDDNDENDENESNENEADDEDNNTFEVDEVGDGGSPLSTVTFTTSDDTIEVEFKAEQDAYVEMQKEDETMLFADTIPANEEMDPFDVSDEEKIYFNVGNAVGLTIYINGEELEYPVDRNEKVHQKIWVNFKKN